MPRIIKKIRGGMLCLKEHGVKYTVKLILKDVLKKIFPESFLKLNRLFRDCVLEGYKLYESYINQFGDDVCILTCAWRGTGDYYISGLYLQAWLYNFKCKNYIFLTPGGAERNVMRLFSAMDGHAVQIGSVRDLCALRGFLGTQKTNFVFLHHQVPYPLNWKHNITNSALCGHRGLNMVDFYLILGFRLSRNTTKSQPQFSNDIERIKQIFYMNNLPLGRTVLISPYSAGLNQFLFPIEFWEKCVERLKGYGYTVCTNCAAKERPIKGTTSLLVPYKDIVPFLNLAGGFIGIRSGLCDVVATAHCPKVILHTYKAKWWPDGNSIAYTGLNSMGLCNDAVELEITKENMEKAIPEIVQAINRIA